jgi:hypothetical protein
MDCTKVPDVVYSSSTTVLGVPPPTNGADEVICLVAGSYVPVPPTTRVMTTSPGVKAAACAYVAIAKLPAHAKARSA